MTQNLALDLLLEYENALCTCGIQSGDIDYDKLSDVRGEYSKKISQKMNLAQVEWCLSNDTGVSSERIMRHMMGLEENERWRDMAPSDADDRGRCIRLLNKFPEYWERLDEMRMLSKNWDEQIDLIIQEANKEKR